MKLQAQYSRITVLSTLFVLLIAAAGYYFFLSYVLNNQLDEALKVEEAEIHDYIRKNNKLPAPTVYKDQRISFSPVKQPGKRSFKSLQIFNTEDNENEWTRQLLFPVSVNGQDYLVDVTKSEEGTNNLVWIILISTGALIILLSVILYFTNRFLISKLWRPFHEILAAIKGFNLSAPVAIREQVTRINEFRELNESVKMMAQKVMRDYQSLKDFTDNASHEMQTPLAVINSKLDVLIQNPELSEASMEQIQGIYTSVEKLSRLCQSLLLLARIENNQYSSSQQVMLHELLAAKRNEMQEWMESMNFKMEMLLDPLPVTMNSDLAEILVGNLISNAIRHNDGNGNITVQTGNRTLTVSNSGKTSLDKNQVFDRFHKSDYSEGSGLGLAIVRHICEHYHFKLNYEFRDGKHCFSVIFNTT